MTMTKNVRINLLKNAYQEFYEKRLLKYDRSFAYMDLFLLAKTKEQRRSKLILSCFKELKKIYKKFKFSALF
jgi:hypothetical protein